MASSNVTSKGQVTIPKEVRDALRIQVGDRVSFTLRADGVVELRPETVDLQGLYGLLATKEKSVGVEQMNDDIGAAVVASFARSTRR